VSSDVEAQTEVRDRRLQLVTIIVAAGFIVVGVLGFIPGVTSHYQGTGGMVFMGHDSQYKLLHVFQVSVFHNAVHLFYGLVGLLCAFTPASARIFLLLGGVVYLALWIYGLAIDQDSKANFVPLNTADNWLHLGLGVGMIVLGIVFGRRKRTRSDAA
jgi:hypothetical protein